MKKRIRTNEIKCPICISSSITHKFNSDKFRIIFCRTCLNSFTYPVPTDMSRYYTNNYWISGGFIGKLKNSIYSFAQIRRRNWIMNFLEEGEILDVGSGEGIFSKLMSKKIRVISIDVPSAKIKNPNVLKVDFLKWAPKKKFDAIVFWESLEHTNSPLDYIKKAKSILKTGGYIFIEYPNADSLEARLLKKYWFHLDPPRHLFHFTPSGMNKLLSKTDLTAISHSGVFAFEYTIGGFVESILNLFLPQENNFFKDSQNFPLILLTIPLILISALTESILFIFGQSPIYLSIARKN